MFFLSIINSKKITYISVVVDNSDPSVLRLQHAGADRASEFALHRRFNPYEVTLEEDPHNCIHKCGKQYYPSSTFGHMYLITMHALHGCIMNI